MLVVPGIDVSFLVAGLLGGVVAACFFTEVKAGTLVKTLVVGALAGNYFAVGFQAVFGTNSLGAAFAVGIGGIPICKGIVKFWENYQIQKGSADD